MSRFSFLKHFFKKSITTKKIQIPQKDLSTLKQFDDVWVKIKDEIYEGWVVNIVNTDIQIVYTDKDNKLKDISFLKERPLNRTCIEKTNCSLLLNNPYHGSSTRSG